jgi:dephospho-CoA kinase
MRNKPIVIGVTGGIGTGKSTVCQIIEVFGYRIYYADERAKWLMNHNAELKNQILELFGSSAYRDDQLNRAYVAQMVFDRKELLDKLNALVHPAVNKDFQNWINQHNAESFLFKEAALLVETGSYKELDFLCLVKSPEALRVSRLLNRDPHRSREDIFRIMKNQLDDKDKEKVADFIIENIEQTSLILNVKNMLYTLLSHRK